jgi:hypothetical protein
MVAGLLVALALAGGAWWRFGRGGTGGFGAKSAQLSVKWRGRYQGSMALPATLDWCPVTRIGVLEAVSGDSGVAIVLYEKDALSSGPHPLLVPEVAAAGPRPAASAAMRWMRLQPDSAVTGFRSDGGTLRITITGGNASGDINAHMRSAVNADTLIIQGTFTNVPVVATAKGCT